MLKKLRSKKGFTLVEMIVVIAIISIMLTVGIVLMNINGNVLTVSEEKAETFYYSLQRAASDAKSVDVPFPLSCDHILVCVSVDTDGNVTDLSYAKISGGTVTDPTTNNLVTDLPDIASAIDNLFESYDEPCCFYGLIDSSFRVEKTFNTACTYADAKGAGFAVSGNTVGGALAGAYPTAAGASGSMAA